MKNLQDEIIQAAQAVGTWLSKRNSVLATAESCTGGWIAEAITAIPGSSAWFDRGFVTYSNSSKVQMLNVAMPLLDQFGAVSQEVVRAMAEGAIDNSDAEIAIATSGIAGPTGGSPEKPVGLVWFAWKTPTTLFSECQYFSGDRRAIRAQATLYSLKQLIVLEPVQSLQA
ncbi:MAG: CinA family protein [Legionellales bacterium]|nr:CinA family protein [Legionellales bacterium]